MAPKKNINSSKIFKNPSKFCHRWIFFIWFLYISEKMWDHFNSIINMTWLENWLKKKTSTNFYIRSFNRDWLKFDEILFSKHFFCRGPIPSYFFKRRLYRVQMKMCNSTHVFQVRAQQLLEVWISTTEKSLDEYSIYILIIFRIKLWKGKFWSKIIESIFKMSLSVSDFFLKFSSKYWKDLLTTGRSRN